MAPSPPESCIVCNDGSCRLITTKTGVRVCHSCKAFFSANRRKAEDFDCVNDDDQCPVSKTGDFCKSCRFNKCMDMGMDPGSKRHVENGEDPEAKRARRETTSGSSQASTPGSSTELTSSSTGFFGSSGSGSSVLSALTSGNAFANESDRPTPASGQRGPDPAALRHQFQVIIANVLVPRIHQKCAFAAIVDTAYPIYNQSVQTFAFQVAQSNYVKSISHMTRERVGFTHLSDEVLRELSFQSFFLTHVLDAVWAMQAEEVEPIYTIQGRDYTIMEIVCFCNEDAVAEMLPILGYIAREGFGHLDYCLYRQLAFFSSAVMQSDENYRNNHLNILNAWRMFRLPTDVQKVMRTFKKFVKLSQIIRDALIDHFFRENLETQRNLPLVQVIRAYVDSVTEEEDDAAEIMEGFLNSN